MNGPGIYGIDDNLEVFKDFRLFKSQKFDSAILHSNSSEKFVNIDEFINFSLDEYKDVICYCCEIIENCSIRIGVYFNPMSVAVVGIDLSASTVKRISAMGVDIEFSIFPTNDTEISHDLSEFLR
jgi:hypothetical protein